MTKPLLRLVPPQPELVRASVKPLVKWVGGKRWLAPTIAPKIHGRLASTNGRYIEPFLGGAAVALDLGLPKMILGDMCRPLIMMYEAIRKTPQAVAFALQTLVERGTDEATYYKVRTHVSHSPVLAAARFIYINKLGYNGLYRENNSGGCNVPYGKDPNKGMPTAEHISAVSKALLTSNLNVAPADVTIARALAGDVIYADPPYLGTFSSYTAARFDEFDHVALASALRAAHTRGVAVIASNTDNERVRELYSWASIAPIYEQHIVAADGDKRGQKAALLICSDDTLLAS